MAAHIFITTSKGFVKGAIFNKETKETTVEYVDRLRYAQAFSAKPAVAFLKKHNIEGFLYNPFEQEPVRDMYKVVKRSEYSIMNERDNLTQEYYVQKAIMENDTDISFLLSGKRKAVDLMTFEEARDKAIELNSKMILELTNKLKLQVNLEPDKLWKQDSDGR